MKSLSFKMMKLVVLSGLVAVACAGTINHGWKIVGGSNAAAGQFPYIVSLRKVSHSCGGSILNDRWILTAAHCVLGSSPSTIKIVAGSNVLGSGGNTYSVSDIFWHEDYNSWTIENDIALLKLSSSISFGTNVAAVPLSTNNIGGGEDAVLCGWGTTSYPGSIPNNLQWTALKTLANDKCNSAHSGGVFSSNVCTLTKSGEGACHGDSGGPLTDASGNQIGIVSWGRPCAVGYPDVFTRVYSFLNWIEDKMANN